MAEDWNAIAAEVDEAIKSIGETDAGFSATLRTPGAQTGGEDEAPVYDDPTYTTLRVLDSNERIRSADGTLVERTVRTLTVGTGAGVVPVKNVHRIAVGITADEADEDSEWHEIAEIRPLAPAGVTVLYEIDLAV